MRNIKTILKSLFISPEIFFYPLKITSIFLLLFQLTCSDQIKLDTQDQIVFEQIHLIDGVERQIFADFDGDGNEEYIHNVFKGGVVLYDFDGPNLQSACQFVGTLKAGRYQAFDLIGDPSPEIFIPVKRGNSVWIEVFEVVTSFGDLSCRYVLATDTISGIDLDENGEWDGEIDKLQVVDINNDGTKDILTDIATGFDRHPRGVCAFDGNSGKKLWEFSTAGQTCHILCADVNNDGNEEIVFGAWAPNNGVTIGDMDDSHSYLICLSKNGNLLWKHVMGGVFTATSYIFTNIDSIGERNIICTYSTGNQPDKSTRNELQLRDGESGRVLKYFQLPKSFYQPFLTDFDHDNKNEIIITNQNGCIYLFNMQLETLRYFKLGAELETYQIHNIVDINQNGSQEVLVTCGNKFLILNSNFEILGKYESTMSIGQVHYFRHPYYDELISLTQSSTNELRNSIFLKIQDKSIFKKIAYSADRKFSIAFFIGVFLSGCLAMIILLKIIPTILKKSFSSSSSKLMEQRDLLLNTLSAFGHGKTATTNLGRLCLLFKNPPEDEKSLSEYHTRVEKAFTTFNSVTFNQIDEIIKRSRVANIGVKYINDLQNNFEKLDLLLNNYKKEDISKNQSNIYSEEIPATIDSIEENIVSIIAELTRYYQSDIFTTIKEVLASFSNDLKAEAIDFKNLMVKGDIAARAFVGKTDLTTIFENLIRNAIESMKQTPIKELLVKIIADDDRIFLEITDTGCGIEPKNFDKIFDREFSTKTDGGFGLYHAKTTLNKYGGKISVANSELGKGTTMRIEIKRV